MTSEKGILQFTPDQRSQVFKALDEAEERTTSYYCIPPFRWEQLRYDLLTQADQGYEPLPDSKLARVRHLQRVHYSRSFDFYRIELNDRSILAAAIQENILRNLYPFLVYILTHEMVHLVRLSSILDNWTHTLAPFDESEEHRVQSIARRILSDSLNFQPVLDRFCGGSAIPSAE
jgi:hypothetical protein